MKWRITNDGRECSRCGIYKLWSEFGYNKHGTRGYQSWCKDCFRKYTGATKKPEYLITDEGRECSECGKFRPWIHYHKRRDLSTGHASHCRECRRKRTKRDTENGSIRNRELRRKYGIGLDVYNALVEKQCDSCAICGTTEKPRRKEKKVFWSVDHDHETGEIRELLCTQCNALLGMAKDNPDILYKAIAYLEANGKQ